MKPDPAVIEFTVRVAGLSTLAVLIRARLSPKPPDINKILAEITGLLDESITGLSISECGPAAIDLSKINFEALAQQFRDSKHKNTDL